MARVTRSFAKHSALALVLSIGLGCSSGGKKTRDATDSSAATTGNTNNGGSGGASGQAVPAASAGTGGNAGAGASGSGGHAGMIHTDRGGTGRAGPGSGGMGGSDAGSMQSTDAEVGSDCIIEGDIVIPNGSTLPQDDCNSCTCHNGALQCTTHLCPPACVVARHLDTCCATYEPVLRPQLDADECLAAYPGTGLDPDLLQRCAAKSPVNCAIIDCADEVPLSRIAVYNAGACAYGDECENDEDCALAWDSSACCSCTESMPTSLLASDECLLPNGWDAGLPGTCPGCSVRGSCATNCPEPPASAKCTLEAELKTCK